MVMNLLADRLAGEDKGTAVMTGMTMAVAGVAAVGGMLSGSEIGGPVAGVSAQMQQEVGGRS